MNDLFDCKIIQTFLKYAPEMCVGKQAFGNITHSWIIFKRRLTVVSISLKKSYL